MTDKHFCEETVGFDQDNHLYIRCGNPAKILVKHVGRNEGPYWMCDPCASHNIHNRGGQDITASERIKLIDRLTEHIDELEQLYYTLKARHATGGWDLKTITLLRDAREQIKEDDCTKRNP